MKTQHSICLKVSGILALCLFQLSISAAPKISNQQDKATQLALEHAYKILVQKKTHSKIGRNPTKAQKREQSARIGATLIAKKQLNSRYRWGGTSPKTGFDCSGLMQYAYKKAKVNLPRTAAAQYKHTKRVSLNKLMVGDLIFFHTRRTRARVNHVGIYLGGNKFIHAPRKGKRVSIANLNKYWRKKAVGAGRV